MTVVEQPTPEEAGLAAERATRSGLSRPRIGMRWHLFETVESTNEEAARLAGAGVAEGTVVVADAQRRGRGRMGRRWDSPSRLGLYMSVVLRPPIAAHDAPVLSLVGAVAAAEAIERETGLAAKIKWPNDLVLRGLKVGGILGEVQTGAARVQAIILGIGINVNQTVTDFPVALRGRATSLRIEAGSAVDRGAMTRALCDSLDRWYDRFLSAQVGAILDEVRRRCLTVGCEVVAWCGGQPVRGLALEVDDSGALVIEDAAGRRHRLVAADVTLKG
jgi:BirA family biotin operon repressor/biotin-[acetyl-CoA-carboxylase] ligase